MTAPFAVGHPRSLLIETRRCHGANLALLLGSRLKQIAAAAMLAPLRRSLAQRRRGRFRTSRPCRFSPDPNRDRASLVAHDFSPLDLTAGADLAKSSTRPFSFLPCADWLPLRAGPVVD